MATIMKNYQHGLRQDLLDKGFSLKEEGDHFVYLRFRGFRMAAFTQHVTLDELNQTADMLWQEMVKR